MKVITHLALLCAAVGLAVPATAHEMVQYRAQPGGKMRMEGTSTMHDWHAESSFLGGRLELDAAFPSDPASRDMAPGKVPATATVTILVRTFKSSSGAAMDSIMQETMNAKNHPRIEFKLTELVFKEFKEDAMVFDASGDLTVNGQTRPVNMPVQIQRVDASNLKITGTTQTKMTDFGIQPPAPKIALGAIRTGDEVKLIFEWNVRKTS